MKKTNDCLPVTVLSGFSGCGPPPLLRMVYPCAHGIIRHSLGHPWTGEERLTQVVFIGRNPRTDEIPSGLEGCKA
jgi:hypothetical protein